MIVLSARRDSEELAPTRHAGVICSPRQANSSVSQWTASCLQPPMRRRYQRRCARRCSRVSRRSRSSRTASSTARSAATCAGIERSGSSSASSRSMWRVRTCSAVWIETSGAGSRAAPCPGSCAAHDGGAARCRSTYSIGTTMRTSLSLPVILCQRFRRTRLRTDGTPVPSTAANSA